MLVRLDKYIASVLVVSRKDAAAFIKKGRITVNGVCAKSGDSKVDSEKDTVTFDGETLTYSEFLYFMLNKPKGFVCAAEDRRDGTVLELFPPEYRAKGISTVGRLDKDTTGLLIITNDGALTHALLSPKNHVEKTYLVTCDKPFCEGDKQTMLDGITIDGKQTAPARLELSEDAFTARVTLTEGKFHEVKRLCYACGEKEVTSLERLTFAGLALDETLDRGEWRELTGEELALLKSPKIYKM